MDPMHREFYVFDPEQFKHWCDSQKDLNKQDYPAAKNGDLKAEAPLTGFWQAASWVTGYSNESMKVSRSVAVYVSREIAVLNGMLQDRNVQDTLRELSEFKIKLNDGAERLTLGECRELSDILIKSAGRDLQETRKQLVYKILDNKGPAEIKTIAEGLCESLRNKYLNGNIDLDNYHRLVLEEMAALKELLNSLLPESSLRSGTAYSIGLEVVVDVLKNTDCILMAYRKVRGEGFFEDQIIREAVRCKIISLEVAKKINQGKESALREANANIFELFAPKVKPPASAYSCLLPEAHHLPDVAEEQVDHSDAPTVPIGVSGEAQTFSEERTYKIHYPPVSSGPELGVSKGQHFQYDNDQPSAAKAMVEGNPESQSRQWHEMENLVQPERELHGAARDFQTNDPLIHAQPSLEGASDSSGHSFPETDEHVAQPLLEPSGEAGYGELSQDTNMPEELMDLITTNRDLKKFSRENIQRAWDEKMIDEQTIRLLSNKSNCTQAILMLKAKITHCIEKSKKAEPLAQTPTPLASESQRPCTFEIPSKVAVRGRELGVEREDMTYSFMEKNLVEGNDASGEAVLGMHDGLHDTIHASTDPVFIDENHFHHASKNSDSPTDSGNQQGSDRQNQTAKEPIKSVPIESPKPRPPKPRPRVQGTQFPLEPHNQHMMSLRVDVQQRIDNERQQSTLSDSEMASALYQRGLLKNIEDFGDLKQAWGKSSKLNERTFIEDYETLINLYRTIGDLHREGRCGTIAPPTFSDLAAIHLSGLLTKNQSFINLQSKSMDENQALVEAIYKDYNDILMKDNPELKRLGLIQAGLPMHNWGNNCWVNASLKLAFAAFSELDILNLKRQTLTGLDGQAHHEKEALKEAFIAAWEVNQQAESGHHARYPTPGHQRNIMNCLYNLGQNDWQFGELRECFESPLPLYQRDASQVVMALNQALNIDKNPRFSIKTQSQSKAVFNGNTIKKRAGTEDAPMLNLAIAQRASGSEILAASILPEAYQTIKYHNYQTPQQNQLKGDLLHLADQLNKPMADDDQRVVCVRAANTRLETSLLKLAASTVEQDAIVVDENYQLMTDYTFKDGSKIQKGRPLFDHNGQIIATDPVYGRPVVIGFCEQADTGEVLFRYKDGQDDYAKGVAVIASNGALKYPYLQKEQRLAEDFKPFPHVTLNPGEHILTLDGHSIPQGYQVVKPRLLQLLRGSNLTWMNTHERYELAEQLAQSLGIHQLKLDNQKIVNLSQKVSLESCLATFKSTNSVPVEWDENEFEKNNIPITEWYPAYLQQEKIEGPTDLPHTQEAINWCNEHKKWMNEHIARNKGLLGKPGEPVDRVCMKLPTERTNVFTADLSALRRFTIAFNMFEAGDQGANQKRTGHAKEAFLNGGYPNITLPIIDEKGLERPVKAELKSLVLHGGTATGGHYINVTFSKDQQGNKVITVHDDSVVLHLADYLKYTQRDTSWTLEDFIQNTAFTPYIGLYERGH